MVKIELMLFGVFLLMVIILDIIMLISLIKLGDERKKLIIGKQVHILCLEQWELL